MMLNNKEIIRELYATGGVVRGAASTSRTLIHFLLLPLTQ